MASYRHASPPGVTRIELRTHDPKKLMTGLLAVVGGAIAFSVITSIVATTVLPRDLQPLVIALTMGVMGLGFVAGKWKERGGSPVAVWVAIPIDFSIGG